MSDVLDEVVAEISAAPHSAASLTLYALVSTMEFEQAGYLFKLGKLRDLSAPQRQLAYRLMELMVQGANRGERWTHAKQQMDGLVRNG
ncbi:MAG: hypothetical protein H6955_14180 [Chromatiaceae bacterium]|nr:hypothetical protein [Gammaproteobacteria bacterium]MCP5314702.1 hypothetical protein [Chromatiaceae bacterium]